MVLSSTKLVSVQLEIELKDWSTMSTALTHSAEAIAETEYEGDEIVGILDAGSEISSLIDHQQDHSTEKSSIEE